MKSRRPIVFSMMFTVVSVIIVSGCAHGQQPSANPNLAAQEGTRLLPDAATVIQMNEDPDISIPRLSSLIRVEVNKIRKAHNLNGFEYDPIIDPIALGHSEDMASNNYFEHTNLAGDGPTERGLKAGFECKITFGNTIATGLAENLFLTHTYRTVSTATYTDRVEETYDFKTEAFLAEEIAEGWYNSPPHRKNLLEERALSQGIGIHITAERKVYVTQNIC